MNHEPLLSVTGLKKHFLLGGGFLQRPSARVRAVDGVDLDVRKGETFGLVGESGCGKTTLARVILRLEEPTQGNVFFEGRDIHALDHRSLRSLRKEMQIIFHDPYASLNPRKKVRRIIGEAFKIHGILSRKDRLERINELTGLVGLRPESINRYPYEFSGGQRQRISVARALALDPKLIVADEPVSALDVSIRAQILNLLVRLQQRFDLTYVFMSRDLSVVRHFCDRIAVMYSGRIVERADREDLFTGPRHPYTQALLSATPAMNPDKKRTRIILQAEVPNRMNPPEGCAFHPRCRRKKVRCTREAPLLKETQEGHRVACHYQGT
jgi:oligopeptide/dipeptide ABC transporter ATP-binding protein